MKNFPGIVIAEEAGWKDCIEGSNAVVNLAGMPISTRWSPEVGIRRIILNPKLRIMLLDRHELFSPTGKKVQNPKP